MRIIIILLFCGFSIVKLNAQETTRVFTSPGQEEKAIVDSLTRSISLDSLNAHSFAMRGEIVYKLNYNYPRQKYVARTISDALKDIKHAITLDNQNPDYRKILSDFYFYVEDNLDTAIVIITEAIEIDPDNPSWYHRRGFLNAKNGSWDKACEDWEKGSKQSGEDAELCQEFYERNCK